MQRMAPIHAEGTFTVKLTPAAGTHASESVVGRFLLDKVFHGPLEGTAGGQMISVMGSETGSAAYSAIEFVTGTLHDRAGTFAMQHTGVMTRGTSTLVITVVPDSGTGDLKGLTGQMSITNQDGSHSYKFDYALEVAASGD